MATLTNEQIEQKKQQLKQLAEEVKALKDELVEAGAIELSEDDLDQAAGGYFIDPSYNPFNRTPMPNPEPDVDRPVPAGPDFNRKNPISF